MSELMTASFVILVGLGGICLFVHRLYRRKFFWYWGLGWLLNAVYLPVETIYWGQPPSFESYLSKFLASLPTTFCFLLALLDLKNASKSETNKRLVSLAVTVILSIIVAISMFKLSLFMRFFFLVAPSLVWTTAILFLLSREILRMKKTDLLSMLKRIEPAEVIKTEFIIYNMANAANLEKRGGGGSDAEQIDLNDLIPEPARRPLEVSQVLLGYSLLVYGLLQPTYLLSPKYGDSEVFIIPFIVAFLCKAANGLGLAFLLLGDFRAVSEAFRLQSLTAELGVLTASVEHDIRNPISTLQKKIEMLRKKYQHHEPYLIRNLSEMERQIGRISAATDVIPQFRETKDYYRQRFRRWDLLEVLRSAIKSFKDVHKNSDIRIDVVSRKSKIDAFVYRERLLQAFINIITNGIESYQQRDSTGKPSLRIECVLERERNSALISFRDEGGGIPREVLPFVTAPLFSTKAGGKENRGLGLFTAERFIKQHRGSLNFESDGATFTEVVIQLPLDDHSSVEED